jgi:lysine 6-dehydrogenase
MVGSAIAKDLSGNFKVTSVDVNKDALNQLENFKINTKVIDAKNSELIKAFVKQFDYIVNAVPGFMGFDVLKSIIEAGKNVVDISFFPEDAFQLDTLAKENNVIAIVDFGVAPGMHNFLLGYHYERMKIDEFKCYVGGLPKIRNYPFEYKAPFSPIDVIEEYTREARIIVNGEEHIMPALSDPELLDFENIGTLEAFNTDGLRSLLKTVNIKNMSEKTLRYPGHIAKIKFLKDAGFFDENVIDKFGISPIEFTNNILFDKWKLKPDDEEFTVMKVIINCKSDGKKQIITYDLYDEYDQKTKISSMARTTGYAATSALNLLANGLYKNIGINPPEFVGKNQECYDFILDYQKERGINYQKTIF